MQTSSSYPADAVAFSRHRADLPGAELDLSDYPAARPLGPTPRTIRAHVGRRKFGSVASAFRSSAERTGDLAGTVDRLRSRRAIIAPQVGVRLIAMRDAAEQRANRALNTAMLAVAASIGLWIGIPVAQTLIAGKL